jgi:SET family sugar efflux transporter-like MFS transporter
MVAPSPMNILAKLAAVARIPGFLPLSATALALGLATSLAAPYLSLFALTEAHLGPRQLGAYVILSAASNLPVATWLGHLSDRGRSRKPALLLALAGAIIGYAAMSQLRAFPWLVLNSVLLLSLGRAAFAQTFALARVRFESGPGADLTLATNTMRMFFSVAWVVGPALGALVLAQVHFTGFYLVVAGLHALAALIVLPLHAPAAAGGGATRRPIWHHLRQPRIAAATAGFSLIFLCSSLNMIVFPLYIVETLHGEEHHVGWLLGLAAGLEIPLMLGSALVAARRDKGAMIVASGVLFAAYFGCVALARRPWHLYPAQLLSALVVSIAMGLGMSYFQDQLPGEPGVSTALYANAVTLGSVLAGLVFAVLAPHFGHRGVLVACAACSLLASALLSRSRA